MKHTKPEDRATIVQEWLQESAKGVKAEAFAKEKGVVKNTLWRWTRKARNGNAPQNPKAVPHIGQVAGALRTLRSAGYALSPKALAKYKAKGFTLKRKDVSKFKKWVKRIAGTGERLVVAIAGVDRHTLTFHSMTSYTSRKQHAVDIREKI